MNNIKSLSLAEQKALDNFKKELKRLSGKLFFKLFLFGSRARLEGHEDSDVDVLVLLPKEDNGLKIKIWDAAYAIFDKTGIYLSPLVLSDGQFKQLKNRERLIASEIERDGIAL